MMAGLLPLANHDRVVSAIAAETHIDSVICTVKGREGCRVL